MDIEADKGEALVFATALMQQVNTEDVANMVQVQRGMLQRFEKTNEMLINFNQLSFSRYEASVKDFQQHTQLLYDMKKDLDSIFKRIRSLKQRLSKSYPEAFAAACSSVIMMEDEEDEDDITTTTATTATSTTTTTTTQPEKTTRSSSVTASRGAAKKSEGNKGGSATSSARKPRPKSLTSRREEGSGGVAVRKLSRSATESRGSSGATSHAKLI